VLRLAGKKEKTFFSSLPHLLCLPLTQLKPSAFVCIKLDSYSSSDPIIHDVWMWRSLHQCDGVEDVVNVVAEVENRIGYDCLGGGDAG